MSWPAKPLGAICEIVSGITKDSKKQGDDYREVPYLRVANVQRLQLDLSEVKTIPAKESTIASYRLEPGDILLNEGGDRDKLGRGWIWQGQISECIHQNHVFRARIRDGKAIPKWIAYYANTNEARAYFLATGKQTTNLASISKKNLSALPVPLPPVHVQETLVAEIDTQLSRLDEAVTTLQGIQAKLKQARASILKAAVEGRLVETEAELAAKEHREFQCATERLIDFHLQRKERRSERRTRRPKHATDTTSQQPGEQPLPGWHLATVGQLIDGIQAGKSFAALNRSPGISETGIAKISAVTWGLYSESESKTVTNPDRINEDYIIQEGDVLMSRANTVELVGAVVIARNVQRRIMLSDKILRLQAPSEIKEWLLLALRSPYGREQIESLCTGNQESMRNIGQDRIMSIKVPLPPFGEQLRITTEVDRRFSVLDQVEATVHTSLARCGMLRQAILKQAFEGRLVPAA